jgi:hypothetical protein
MYLSACLLACLTPTVLAQTPKQVPGDASRPNPAPVVQPRKERPTVMEALMQKDKRLALTIKKLASSSSDKGK